MSCSDEDLGLPVFPHLHTLFAWDVRQRWSECSLSASRSQQDGDDSRILRAGSLYSGGVEIASLLAVQLVDYELSVGSRGAVMSLPAESDSRTSRREGSLRSLAITVEMS